MGNKTKSEVTGDSLGNSRASAEDKKPVDFAVNIDLEIEEKKM
jgi:hypothetical protein